MLKTGVKIVQSRIQDSSILNEEYINSFDRVLLDAPCSGLGDLRHKPEIRFHLKPENIDELVLLQSKLLDVNASYVKENGILLYSTCTLNKKENEKQISKFLEKHTEFELIEEKTLLPYEENSDGFYYAKMRKKA
jgi:16S rRNA (cytosine967-C5)-methyltransferase